MKFDVMDNKFRKKIKEGLLFIINREPPYLLHCEAGIDRTGFLSILLESFMGAKFDDIVKDYMLSFVEDSEYSFEDYKNGSIFITNLFSKIKGDIIKADDDLQFLSTQYLFEKVKLMPEKYKCWQTNSQTKRYKKFNYCISVCVVFISIFFMVHSIPPFTHFGNTDYSHIQSAKRIRSKNCW
jgi:hypothetical protein